MEHEQDVPEAEKVSQTEIAEGKLANIDGTTFSTEGGRLSIDGRVPRIDDISIENGFNIFLEKYRLLIVGVLGTATITAIAFFIVHFMELGASAGNVQKRQEAISGLLWSGIATAGIGGATTFVAFFVNAL